MSSFFSKINFVNVTRQINEGEHSNAFGTRRNWGRCFDAAAVICYIIRDYLSDVRLQKILDRPVS